MIVYQSTKKEFLENVFSNDIEVVVLDFFETKLGRSTNKNEVASWKNSLSYMDRVLRDNEIPDDAGVTIEYRIPQTSKRIDFILTGQNHEGVDHAVLIELKQWSSAALSEKDGIVSTYVGNAVRDVSHPSYQVWSYAALLNGFNKVVYEENIQLKPCAYLHNYLEDDVIRNNIYAAYLEKAPIFLKHDALKLRNFIKQFVKYGDKTKIMYRIDGGRIRPSKNLADSMAKMLQGNQEFIMIDDQKVVYETALMLAKQSTIKEKNILIIEGGPGTGKSVVAVNLLVALMKMGLLAQYVTKNAAPRAVYESKLTGTLRRTEFSNLFSGSGSFTDVEEHIFDVLIVDEAHRLNAKSGMFKNLGENQIKEIINASKFSVFFVDEDQCVTWHDIGRREEIEKWAKRFGITIHSLKLESQFRCNGSDGYLAWLDNTLQIRETANTSLEDAHYDFRIFENPHELRDLIFEKNKINNKARLVAGYCWNWVSKKDKQENDIVIPEYDFGMQWNLASDGNLWILAPESVKEVGCIHTCQGLEVDYIGVIVGLDLVVRDGKIVTDPDKRAKTDASLRGYKSDLKEDSENAKARSAAIIKNTYRTLMTRGMKGCYVYFVDKETEYYFKSMLGTE